MMQEQYQICTWTAPTYLHFLTVDFYGLDHEINAYCSTLARWEVALGETPDQTRFAHTGVTHQHHFEEKFIIFHREHQITSETQQFETKQ